MRGKKGMGERDMSYMRCENTPNNITRYSEYWMTRFAYRNSRQWRQLQRKRLTSKINLPEGGLAGKEEACVYGTPLSRRSFEKEVARYDLYYKKRFRWRWWNMSSVEELARRGFNAIVG